MNRLERTRGKQRENLPGEVSCQVNELLVDVGLIVRGGLVELGVDDGLRSIGVRVLNESSEIIRGNGEQSSDSDSVGERASVRFQSQAQVDMTEFTLAGRQRRLRFGRW